MTRLDNEGKLPGRLIAAEGLDGSGKSTQIYLLRRWLELGGYKVHFTEWNSSSLVKNSTKRAKKERLLTPTTYALIHCTDFADRYERQIYPLLKAGYIVLADRYIYTAFARDGARGVDRDWISSAYGFARKPDVTFFFKTPPDKALARVLERKPKLKYYSAGMDMGFSEDPYQSFKIFQGKINEEYLKMAEKFNFIVIDGMAAPDIQQREVREIILRGINLKAFKVKYGSGYVPPQGEPAK
jgi:dTMP kinase